LRDNPTCKLVDAAALLGVKGPRVRKWKQFGWIEHLTPSAARRLQAEEATEIMLGKQPDQTRKQSPGRNRKPSSGAVGPAYKPMAATPVASPPMSGDIDELIARGRDLKISEIRALVKANLVAQVHDAKAVSNFAAGLKALSGVQDVELEDIYESEQLIRIYVPEEITDADVLEVDPLER
jgi:hypothetical protein